MVVPIELFLVVVVWIVLHQTWGKFGAFVVGVMRIVYRSDLATGGKGGCIMCDGRMMVKD